MPSIRDRHSPLVTEYVRFGDRRPPAAKLATWAQKFETSNRLSKILVKSSILLDLAMADPQNAQQHLDNATEALDRITDQVYYMYRQGRTRDAAMQSEYAAAACLRRAELPMWRNAATGAEPVAVDYHALVEAATLAARDFTENPKGYAQIIWSMPAVLLERGARMSLTPPLIGRMSLTREGFRIPEGLVANWSWGFTPVEQDSPLTNTPFKVQVRAGMVQAHKYAPHIAVVGAKGFRIHHVEPILERCRAEEGLPGTFDVDPVSESALNFITEALYQRVTHPEESTRPFNVPRRIMDA